MDVSRLREILQKVKQGDMGVDGALDELRDLPYEDLGYAKIDHHRPLRVGLPEVVFCQGKTPDQVAGIMQRLSQSHAIVIGTRATPEVFEAVSQCAKDAIYFPEARIIAIRREATEPCLKAISGTGTGERQKSRESCKNQIKEGQLKKVRGTISVVSAGTADLPVAEEAAVTAELLGNPAERVYDVGVAGIHRLLDALPRLRGSTVIIVVAGMEGALPSVVAGLVDRPVVAVPTSVGYGASFHGLSALLAMLNSCAPGIGVVNIDNGFGAAILAHLINRL
ncbi:MAG: nickel pincer cofactor biosynthesis protein LarB [Bacillota bacterium]